MDSGNAWERFKVTGQIEPGVSGDWSISTISCSEEQALLGSIETAPKGCYRPIQPGEYTRLMRGETVVMSDTKAEIEDVMPFFEKAHGKVLIAGLGLGLVPQALLDIGKVDHIVIVEKSRDVYELTGKRFRSRSNVDFVFGDIFKDWQKIFEECPEAGDDFGYFDFGWFDIWAIS